MNPLPVRVLAPALLLVACSSGPRVEYSTPPPNTKVEDIEPEKDDQSTPLARAKNLFGTNDFAGARRALEEALADDPDHHQALYLHARTLMALGEYRGAKADCLKVLEASPKNTLAVDLLASLYEHLGEHREAIGAYAKLSAQLANREQEVASYLRAQGLPVPRGVVSHAPLVGMARCHLYLGEAAQALAVLDRARAASSSSDAWVEYWRFVTLNRMQRATAAETAGRVFLRTAKSGFAPQQREVRRWLASKAQSLPADSRQLMIDYVRAACRLRLPRQTPPEDAVLERAPERLIAFDDRPVFVTLIPPQGKPRFFGRGRGRSLAGALKGALESLQEDPRYRPLLVRGAAIRIDVGRELQPAKFERTKRSLGLTPRYEVGHHGVGLRTDGKEVYLLPADPSVEDLEGLEAAMEFACARAGVGRHAWQSAGAIYRFETEAFLSASPGAAPQTLVGVETSQRPEPTLRALRKSLDAGARFLTRLIQPKAGLPRGYSAPRNVVDRLGGDGRQVLPANVHAHAAAILAFRRLATYRGPHAQGAEGLGASSSKVLDAACDHLLGHGIGADLDVLSLSASERAHLLEALSALPNRLQKRCAKLAESLASALRQPPQTSRLAAARALLAHHAATGDARWEATAWSLVGSPANLNPNQPDARSLLVLLAAQQGKAAKSAQARLVAWAQSALSDGEATTPGRTRALVAAARLADARQDPQAKAIRAHVVNAASDLLALQLAEQHRWLCAAPNRALGGFRDDLGSSHLRPRRTAECLLAIADCFAYLSR
jgi:tetratricopeptide (TPR) repeat protein